MSFKSRQKKRMKKAAIARTKRTHRGLIAQRYYLTPVKRDTCCAKCAGLLRVDREMVYRKSPREALCVPCADSSQVPYRPSVRWERARISRK